MSAPRPVAIDAVLARSRHGLVCRARVAGLDGAVAIKTGDAAAPERLFREAHLLASVRHPHVLPVVGWGLLGQEVALPDGGEVLREDTPFAVLALARDTLASAPPRSWAALEGVLVAVLEALAQMHALGVVHRDIKPGNVLLGAAGQVWVADLGIAWTVERGRAAGWQAGAPPRSGTASFMAPEQVAGDVSWIGPRTDLHALGAMAWGLATGAPPFASPAATLYAEPPPFRPQMPVPEQLEAWLRVALAKAPEDRFAHAAEALAALAALGPCRGPDPGRRGRTSGESPATDATVETAESPGTRRWSPPRPLTAARPVGGVADVPDALAPDPPTPVPPPWEPFATSARARLLDDPPFIGRRAELEALGARFAAVTAPAGGPAIVWLSGPEGAGRTALAEAFARRLARHGLARRVVLGRGADPLGAMLTGALEAGHVPHDALPRHLARVLGRLPWPQPASRPADLRALLALMRPAVYPMPFAGAAHRALPVARCLEALATERPVVVVVLSPDHVDVSALLGGLGGAVMVLVRAPETRVDDALVIAPHGPEVAAALALPPGATALEAVQRGAARGVEVAAVGPLDGVLLRRVTAHLVDPRALAVLVALGPDVQLADWANAAARLGRAPDEALAEVLTVPALARLEAGRVALAHPSLAVALAPLVTAEVWAAAADAIDDDGTPARSALRGRLLAAAGRGEAAFDAWLRAGEGDLRQGALGQAEEAVNAALPWAADATTRGRLALCRAEVLRLSWRLEAAAAEATLAAAVPGGAVAAALVRARIAQWAGDWEGALVAAGDARAAATTGEQRAEAALEQAVAAHRLGELDRFREAVAVSWPVATASGSPLLAARAHETRATLARVEGRFDEGRALFASAHALYVDAQGLWGAASVKNNLAELERLALRWDEAIGHEREALRLWTEIGAEDALYSELGLAWAELGRGELDAGRGWLDRAVVRVGAEAHSAQPYLTVGRLLWAALSDDPAVFDAALAAGGTLFVDAGLAWALERAALAWRDRGDSLRAAAADTLRAAVE